MFFLCIIVYLINYLEQCNFTISSYYENVTFFFFNEISTIKSYVIKYFILFIKRFV